MGRLNLVAKDKNQELVLAYLEENASDTLAEKINAGRKTLGGFFGYANGEAKRMAGAASSIAIDDATVFGWAVHYFEEDSIKEGAVQKQENPKKKEAEKPKTQERKKQEPKKTAPAVTARFEQLDLFGGL